MPQHACMCYSHLRPPSPIISAYTLLTCSLGEEAKLGVPTDGSSRPFLGEKVGNRPPPLGQQLFVSDHNDGCCSPPPPPMSPCAPSPLRTGAYLLEEISVTVKKKTVSRKIHFICSAQYDERRRNQSCPTHTQFPRRAGQTQATR